MVIAVENKTLIAYVTRGGATEEVAIKLQRVLRQKYGFDVDIINLRKSPSPDISPYRNVIVGSGVSSASLQRGSKFS
ncbi:MAG: flavodoxin domain-containing protein [Candidatus Bathyarchaeia archaeon]